MNHHLYTPLFPRKAHRLIYFSAVFFLITVLSGCMELPYTNLNNDELEAMLKDDVPIYDIRRVDEWKQTGIVTGSQLLTFVDANGRLNKDFLQQFTEDVGPNEPVILICRTGNRTSTLARHLAEKMGYTRVYNVRNGITQWKREKRPVKYL